MVVYAKSKPVETLREHTEKLSNNCQKLKEIYSEEIESKIPQEYSLLFWEVLEMAIKCHDLGKIHTPFQNKIRKVINEPLLSVKDGVEELPHNLLSPAFIKDLVAQYPKEIKKAIYQAIAFHHYRGVEENYATFIGAWSVVKNVIENDLDSSRLQDLKGIIDVDKLSPPTHKYKRYLECPINQGDGHLYNFYILLKGFLHRADHSASAHLDIEEERINIPEQKVTNYLLSNGVPKDKIWQHEITKSLINDNVLLIASTGVGKTEFAFYWLNKDKGFYTLPVRTSVNAMYDRTKETFKTENIGLIHSDSYFYCLEESLKNEIGIGDENDEGLQRSIRQIDIAKQLAMPISITTADQIFTSVFKYKGYEKIYSTLAYSKLIIDEVQSYDPEIVAVILKGLVEISQLGGKFCLMTATLPSIYKNYLKENIEDLKILPPKFIDSKKHKIKMYDCDIEDEYVLKKIKESCQQFGKVLIIVNTVKKAQSLYDKLEKYLSEKYPLSLLHSGFIYISRRGKEKEILDNPKGIWITTQLAEVSLNINFPVLYTELATIDALIQRMGRVLRSIRENFEYEGEPNIHVFLNSSGKGTIYDRTILDYTIVALKKIEGTALSEEDKFNLINEVFDMQNLKGTEYLNKFYNSLTFLESGIEIKTRGEAQNLFRKISNLTVVPYSIYQDNQFEIDQAINTLESKKVKRTERLGALFNLRKYSLSVQMYKLKRSTISPLNKRDLFYTTLKYDPKLGLIPSKEIENTY